MLVYFFIQIECQVCTSVIFRHIRQDVYEHLLFVRLCKRDLIFDLHSFDSKISKHAADDIFCLCCCLQTKLIPFHIYFSFISSCLRPPRVLYHLRLHSLLILTPVVFKVNVLLSLKQC